MYVCMYVCMYVKGKAKKFKKNVKPKDVILVFAHTLAKNVAHGGASGKKGILSCLLQMPF